MRVGALSKAELWPTSRNLLHTSGEGPLNQPLGGPFGKYLGPMGNDQRIFSQWLNEQVGQRRSRVGPQKVFLELLQRSRTTEGENWPAGRREGQHEGPGAWGGGGLSPAGVGVQPGSPPSWRGSELRLRYFESARARAPGVRGIPAKRLHKQGWGQRKGTPPPPVSTSGWVWTPQQVPSSAHLPVNCFNRPLLLLFSR